MEEMNTVRRRRVTFKEVPAAWAGWENPFQEGSDLRADAEEILSCWRQGTSYQWQLRDQDRPQDDPVTVAVVDNIKPRQNEKKEEKSSKLYQRFLKWKDKVILVQNFFKVR